MTNDIDYQTKYDELLDVKPAYGYKRSLPLIKYNYVGFEIEIAVEYDRSKYTYIKTLLKNIKNVVGENGYFTKDGTILGDYSFEIVLDPLSPKKAVMIYDKIMKIVKFSDKTICFDKEHNCGLHMNFNQYDIVDINQAHKRLLILMNQKRQYIEENIYKKLIFEFDFKEYLKFQEEISAKYLGINYLDSKLVEVRNIKTGLSSKTIYSVIYDIINALFPDKCPKIKDIKHTKKIINIIGETFEESNKDVIKKSLDQNLLVISFDGKTPKVVPLNDNIISEVKKALK